MTWVPWVPYFSGLWTNWLHIWHIYSLTQTVNIEKTCDLQMTLRWPWEQKRPIKFCQCLTLNAKLDIYFCFIIILDKVCTWHLDILQKKNDSDWSKSEAVDCTNFFFSIFDSHFIDLGCRLKLHIYVNRSSVVVYCPSFTDFMQNGEKMVEFSASVEIFHYWENWSVTHITLWMIQTTLWAMLIIINYSLLYPVSWTFGIIKSIEWAF